MGQVAQDGDEFIPPHARQGVALAQGSAHAVRQLHQQFVARGVSMGVVDGFEAVQIEVAHGQRALAPQRLQHGLLQPVGQQHAVRQARERVEVRNALQLALLLLHGRDVGEQGDVVARASGGVDHGADRLHLGIDLAILTPVPDLARPVALLLERLPHGGVMLGRLAPRLQNARVLAHGLLVAVAGDAAEGVVDFDDGALRVGDHDGFARVREHAGGQQQPRVRLLAFADVLERHLHRRRTLVPDDVALDLDVHRNAIEADEFFLLQRHRLSPLHAAGNTLHNQMPKLRVHETQDRYTQQLLRGTRRQQPYRGRVDVHQLALLVHRDAHRRVLHQTAVAVFAFAQGAFHDHAAHNVLQHAPAHQHEHQRHARGNAQDGQVLLAQAVPLVGHAGAHQHTELVVRQPLVADDAVTPVERGHAAELPRQRRPRLQEWHFGRHPAGDTLVADRAHHQVARIRHQRHNPVRAQVQVLVQAHEILRVQREHDRPLKTPLAVERTHQLQRFRL